MQNSHAHPPNRNAGRRSRATFGLEQLSKEEMRLAQKPPFASPKFPVTASVYNSVNSSFARRFYLSNFVDPQMRQHSRAQIKINKNPASKPRHPTAVLKKGFWNVLKGNKCCNVSQSIIHYMDCLSIQLIFQHPLPC